MKDEYWSYMAHELIKKYWDLDLHIPVYVNGRLSKTLGTYEFKVENGKVIPLRIQLSKELTKYGSFYFICFILKHELCHFVLSQMKLPYKDGEEFFEDELKRIHAFSSKKIYVLYRIYCLACQEVFVFDSKKSARAFMKSGVCPCEHSTFSKLDVSYKKVKE